MTFKEKHFSVSGKVPRIMGIVNITGDSFYDGGRYLEPEKALLHAAKLQDMQADILDIGAESSRPGAKPVSPELEIERLAGILGALKKKDSVKISVDTSRSAVAREVLRYGIDIINDVYAFSRDPEMAGMAACAGCEVVIMHMQGVPETMQLNPAYEDVTDDIMRFFEQRVSFALSQGIREENIILDPGLGFGKTLEHNLLIIRNISRFKSLGFPVLAGPSRKSFIGQITGLGAEDRIFGTAAAVALLVEHGADIIRVHDVHEMRQVVQVAHAIAGPVPAGAGCL